MVFKQQGAKAKATQLSLALAVLFSSTAAWAGGTANDNQSTAGIATAGAGQAADAADPSVIFFNPAALTRFKRAEVSNVATIALFYNDYTSRQNNDGAPTDSGQRGSAGQGFARQDGPDGRLFVPGLFAAIPINDRLVMGFSASGSHGLLARYDENFPGRGSGREVDLKVTRLNLGFGYQVTPTLSLGFNGSYERYFQSLKLRLNFRDAVDKLSPGSTAALDTAAAVGLAPPIPGETDAGLRMFGWAFNYQGGLLWEPTETTRIGVSYRPKTKFTGNRGKLTINDNEGQSEFREFLNGPIIGLGGPLLGVNGPQAAGDLEPMQVVAQDITFPDEFRFSVFHHATPKLDLMATFTYQDYRDTEIRFVRERNGRVVQDVPQNFKIARSYRVGASYKLYRRLTVMGGVAFENGVVGDDLRLPVLPDNDRAFYGIGLRYFPSRDLTVDLAYQYINVEKGQVGNNAGITPIEVTGGDFKGITNLDVRFLSVTLTQKF